METLVLSTGYEPIGRVTWQRAITLLFMGKVEIVESYEDREIRSITFAIKMPAVIRFLRSLRPRKKAVRFSRDSVFTRDHGQCQYCGDRVTRAEATYDHVVPRAQGGQTTWENVVICCVPCNQQKGGHTPEQAKMKLRTMPVKPKTLPDMLHLTFTWQPGMPDQWRNWLRDAMRSVQYWHGELDQE